jgi:hypothetical protein
MLTVILQALTEVVHSQNKTLTAQDRLELFKEKMGKKTFSRKEYLMSFKTISAPTASRDLKWAVDEKLLKKKGNQRLTTYTFL